MSSLSKELPNNNLQRKLKKLKAVDFHPSNILNDVKAVYHRKHNTGKKWADSTNEELQARGFKPMDVALFAVPGETIFKDPDKIKHLLDKYGICVLTEYVPHETALAAGKEITKFLTDQEFIEGGTVPYNKELPEDRKSGQNKDYAWQHDYHQFKEPAYNAIQEACMSKPYINVRSIHKENLDSGKIDVFGAEQLAQTFSLNNLTSCYEAIHNPEVVAFIEKLSGYKLVQPNLYYDGGVTNPRGPHLDNNLEQFKMFIYLTDVLDPKHGPYSYAPTSHKNRSWMSKERLLNSAKGYQTTEVGSFSFDDYTQMMAPAGTAIISQQSGIHGASKQTKDGRRALIVANYC